MSRFTPSTLAFLASFLCCLSLLLAGCASAPSYAPYNVISRPDVRVGDCWTYVLRRHAAASGAAPDAAVAAMREEPALPPAGRDDTAQLPELGDSGTPVAVSAFCVTASEHDRIEGWQVMQSLEAAPAARQDPLAATAASAVAPAAPLLSSAPRGAGHDAEPAFPAAALLPSSSAHAATGSIERMPRNRRSDRRPTGGPRPGATPHTSPPASATRTGSESAALEPRPDNAASAQRAAASPPAAVVWPFSMPSREPARGRAPRAGLFSVPPAPGYSAFDPVSTELRFRRPWSGASANGLPDFRSRLEGLDFPLRLPQHAAGPVPAERASPWQILERVTVRVAGATYDTVHLRRHLTLDGAGQTFDVWYSPALSRDVASRQTPDQPGGAVLEMALVDYSSRQAMQGDAVSDQRAAVAYLARRLAPLRAELHVDRLPVPLPGLDPRVGVYTPEAFLGPARVRHAVHTGRLDRPAAPVLAFDKGRASSTLNLVTSLPPIAPDLLACWSEQEVALYVPPDAMPDAQSPFCAAPAGTPLLVLRREGDTLVYDGPLSSMPRRWVRLSTLPYAAVFRIDPAADGARDSTDAP